jgi:hypothetical protein
VTSRQVDHEQRAHDATSHSAIAVAEADVARAGVEFSASVQAASLIGRDAAERMASAVRPIVIGLGVVAGTLLVVRLLRGSSSAPSPERHGASSRSSVWSELARSAAISLATVAGRRLVERLLRPDGARG